MDFIRLDKVSAREDGGIVMHVVSAKPLDYSGELRSGRNFTMQGFRG